MTDGSPGLTGGTPGATVSGHAVYRALDAQFRLDVPRPVAAVAAAAYADLLRPPGDTAPVLGVRRRWPRGWVAVLDGRPIDGWEPMPDALSAVRRAVNELAARSVEGRATVLNAAAVDIGGTAVALVGPGSSGKTTVAAAAVRAGHGYLADDVVAVAPDGTVLPFPRPLNVRVVEAARLGLEVPPGPFGQGYPWRVGPERCRTSPVPLGAVVLVARHRDATFTRACPPPEALMRLANQALRRPGGERQAFRRLDALVRRMPAALLYHCDLDAAVAELERLAASASAVEQGDQRAERAGGVAAGP